MRLLLDQHYSEAVIWTEVLSQISDGTSTSILCRPLGALEEGFEFVSVLAWFIVLDPCQFCGVAFAVAAFDVQEQLDTTNFDFLLERQYDLTPRYVYPVVDEEQLSVSPGNAGTLLLKLHGDLRHPSRLIVTDADYDGFLPHKAKGGAMSRQRPYPHR
jgi:hypothetical protein